MDGLLSISYEKKGSNLHISIKDNGRGISALRQSEILSHNQNKNAGHIGIYNIRERIQLYFGSEYDIRIDSIENEYTKFELIIPLIEKEDFYYDKGIIS
ncbi:MAG: two-component system, sensor histidine kinase YesM [Clostridiales bacterium]|nr:two-component system, sensor histidine kinase YesM [Clostridiales bacterium]